LAHGNRFIFSSDDTVYELVNKIQNNLCGIEGVCGGSSVFLLEPEHVSDRNAKSRNSLILPRNIHQRLKYFTNTVMFDF